MAATVSSTVRVCTTSASMREAFDGAESARKAPAVVVEAIDDAGERAVLPDPPERVRLVRERLAVADDQEHLGPVGRRPRDPVARGLPHHVRAEAHPRLEPARRARPRAGRAAASLCPQTRQ